MARGHSTNSFKRVNCFRVVGDTYMCTLTAVYVIAKIRTIFYTSETGCSFGMMLFFVLTVGCCFD